jgi:hypothetical protein
VALHGTAMKLRRRKRVDYEYLIDASHDLNLPVAISDCSAARRQRITASKKRSRREFQKTIIISVGIVLFVAYFVFLGIKFEGENPTSPLPPYVIGVGPEGSFLVAKGHEGIGVLLCEDANVQWLPYNATTTIVSCPDGARSFRYPRKLKWSP